MRFALSALLLWAMLIAAPLARGQDASVINQEAPVINATQPEIRPLFGSYFASDDSVRASVGAISYSMDQCAGQASADFRIVRAQLGDVSWNDPAIISSVMRDAVRFAWSNCARQRTAWESFAGQCCGTWYDVSAVELRLPSGRVVARGSFRGDDAFRPGAQYSMYYEDLTRLDSFWASVRAWLTVLAVAAAAIVAFANRETLARWYYEWRPHPAADMVDAALTRGGEIDGHLYEQVLRSMPGGRIEQAVRARQARDLTERLRRHEAALQSEEARRVAAEQKRVEQENAFARAHAELLKAGVDHELAAARVDELRKASRNR